MALDLTSLSKAVEALDRSLAAVERAQAIRDAALQETVRAGVIQQFEVAYELSWKFLQRWLRENGVSSCSSSNRYCLMPGRISSKNQRSRPTIG